jgi:hypothetical protein
LHLYTPPWYNCLIGCRRHHQKMVKGVIDDNNNNRIMNANHTPPTSGSDESASKMAGYLSDFVSGVDKDNPLDIEVAVDTDTNKVMVFHNKPFTTEISWFEYDINNSKLDFILEDGQTRDFGMALPAKIGKYMQNAHQILTILMNDETGDADEGRYIPLIIHHH